MRKQIIVAGGIIVLGVIAAAGGFFYLQEEAGGTKEESLVYYTIGKEDEDLEKVNESLNELLSERYGFTIDYRKVDWNIYGDRITDAINLNKEMDVVYASSSVQQGNYNENAKKGVWYPLDDFLAGEGKELYEAIPEILWEGAKVNGHIYGVPTSKELAAAEQWMYAKELVDKYDIDIDSIKRIEDLEPIFAMIKKNEPEYTVMELNQYSNNFFAADGYEYILDYQIPLMVNAQDETVELVNIMETDLGEQVLETLRRYYLAGYINQDAPIRESQTLQKGEKVFWRQASGGPYAELDWSVQRGYDVVASMIGPSVITTGSLQGAYMCVASSSDNPEQACQFLKAVNTDKDVRNMLNFGIEGEHYSLNEDGQAVLEKDTYAGVTYTQGNYFLLYTREDQPEDLWEQYQKFNDSAIPSQVLFFEADLSSIEEEIEAARQVSEKYYPALMTGSVDVKKHLPEYREELRKAGIEKIREELQKQLRQWKNHEGKQE